MVTTRKLRSGYGAPRSPHMETHFAHTTRPIDEVESAVDDVYSRAWTLTLASEDLRRLRTPLDAVHAVEAKLAEDLAAASEGANDHFLSLMRMSRGAIDEWAGALLDPGNERYLTIMAALISRDIGAVRAQARQAQELLAVLDAESPGRATKSLFRANFNSLAGLLIDLERRVVLLYQNKGPEYRARVTNRPVFRLNVPRGCGAITSESAPTLQILNCGGGSQ